MFVSCVCVCVCVCVCACVCVCVTSVGLSLLARSSRLGAVLRLDLDQVGGFLLAVERRSSDDDAAARVDAEELRVAALVPQDHVVDLRGKQTEAEEEEEEEEEEVNRTCSCSSSPSRADQSPGLWPTPEPPTCRSPLPREPWPRTWTTGRRERCR